MTPEQNEQWRQAINPLDYLDFQALQSTALSDFAYRVKQRRGAPIWALTMRTRCIEVAWREGHQTWVPEFALRSEVAMVGLKLLYPTPDDRVKLYRRLLFDFIGRSIASLSFITPQLQELQRLCECRTATEEQWAQQWPAIQQKLDELQQEMGCSIVDVSDPLLRYEGHFLLISRDWIELIRRVGFLPPKLWWGTDNGGANLVGNLIEAHRNRIRSGLFPDARARGPHQPVADTFLATLEAECPPPDWLPKN